MPSLKSFLAKVYAQVVHQSIKKWASNPVETQERVFKGLISSGSQTVFGKDHNFENIRTYEDFKNQVPVRDYENLKSYLLRALDGEENIVWPGRPLYFAKTSGTTSGTKYIPLTKDSIPTHISAARNALLVYIATTGKSEFVSGKMIFLQGSPVLHKQNGIPIGRLSGIVAHHVPKYLQKNRLPSYETNCIEDWDAKVNAIINETISEDMTLISGIPPWVLGYFEKLHHKTGKHIGDVFKNFSLFVYGGVNFKPYQSKFDSLIGRPVDSIELFPASEGFFAFQNEQNDPGMLLQLNSGMFFEFIEADHFYDDQPTRITIKDVQLDTNYVLIVSTNAGLWAYNVGDTVKFTSLSPYKLVVTGRLSHFISAFGEHVIGKEVEEAMQSAIIASDAVVAEFTVAPQINPSEGLPYHEWFIEFEKEPSNFRAFVENLDIALQSQNSYYKDLITGKILKPLQITRVVKDGFSRYMESIGKLGGQNKTPRLANDRKLVDALSQQNLTK